MCENLRPPNFILAILSTIVLFLGIGFRANGDEAKDYVLIAGTLPAEIHGIWAIVDVINRHDMRLYQKRFWLLTAVITVPVFGAVVFYGLHHERDRILTKKGERSIANHRYKNQWIGSDGSGSKPIDRS
jgi:hypothetical protein